MGEMSAMREMVAAAINGGNLEQVDGIGAADVLGALARADRLGAALWRLEADLAVSTFHEAEQILAERLALSRAPAEGYVRIARVALMDHLDQVCAVCGGLRVRPGPGPRRACGACGGSGKQPPGKREDHRQVLGSTADFKMLDVFLARAEKLIRRADAEVERQMPVLLGLDGKAAAGAL